MSWDISLHANYNSDSRIGFLQQIFANISLKDVLSKEEKSSLLVLGIPHGELVTANVVVKLGAPLDIIIPRKLKDIDNKENAIGAIMEDGTSYINDETVKFLCINEEYIEQEKAYQIEEIRRRNALYRKPFSTYNFENKTVILVDDCAGYGNLDWLRCW